MPHSHVGANLGQGELKLNIRILSTISYQYLKLFKTFKMLTITMQSFIKMYLDVVVPPDLQNLSVGGQLSLFVWLDIHNLFLLDSLIG